MTQNKATFVVDHYTEVIGGSLDKLTALLNAAGVLFIVEPWSDGWSRVYVKKEAAELLNILSASIKGGKDENTTSTEESPE